MDRRGVAPPCRDAAGVPAIPLLSSGNPIMVNDQDYEDDSGGNEGPDDDGDPGGLPGGRIPGPPIPRDEWVSQVVDDPSSGTQPVLLQGYVGDAADESRTRIYLDASLGTFVDVDNDDVLHHQPLRGDHEPSGGSMVWVRGDAQVSQGTGGSAPGAPAAAGGDFFTGPVLEQNRQAGMGGAPQAGTQVHITLLTVAGCISRLVVCRPQNTAATVCTHQIICSYVCRDPLGGIGTPQWKGGLGGLDIDGTMGCPPSVGSDCATQPKPCGGFQFPTDRWQPQFQQRAAAAPVGPTGYEGCGQPTHMIGCTGYQGCGQPHISLPGCIHTGTCPQAVAGPIGPTGYQGCGQPHISLPGCIHTGICPQPHGGPIGVTGWLGCGQPQISLPGCIRTGICPQPEAVTGPGSTIATVCTQIGCPHTGVANCSIATVCTQIGCHTAPQHCIPSLSGCPNTTATVCTQIGCPVSGDGCPRTSSCPPTYTPGCGGAQAGGLMQAHGGGAQAAAGPTGQYLPQCPTFGFTCTVFCTAQGQAGDAPNEAAGIPTGQYSPQCPTFGFTCTAFCAAQGGMEAAGRTVATHCPTLGFTCTYVHCPPMTIATQGLGCPPTSTCAPTGEFGCPRTSTCPPTFQPGCGPDAEHGGSTAATLCTQAPFCPHVTVQGAAQGAAGIPTGQYSPQCPTFGFTCTYVHCPPITIATQGLGCPPTSTCAPTGGFGCPRTSTCPPTYTPGCGGTEAAGLPNTAATMCTHVGCMPLTTVCLPPSIGCPPAGGTVAGAAMAGPYTHYQGCPTFGFTCTQFC